MKKYCLIVVFPIAKKSHFPLNVGLSDRMVNKIALLLIMFSTIVQSVFAQQTLPLIRANSKSVDVKEDGIMMKGIWNITPGIKPDVYTIMKSKKVKRVTFYTDLDSISFNVIPGHAYDFVILFSSKDSCYTQIRTGNPIEIKYATNHNRSIPDTIPFTLGEDNFIHIKGKINNSKLVDFIVDTGAGTAILTEKGLDKNVKLNLDGTTENIGTGGTTTLQTSSFNKLEISNLRWDSLLLISIDYKGNLHADGVIGSNVFEGKTVAINYDQEILIIYDSLLEMEEGYSKIEMKYRTGQPFVEVTLVNDSKSSTGWFLFDTGSKFSLSVNSEFVVRNKLDETMESIGTRRSKGSDGVAIKSETVLLPILMIGGYKLSQVPIDLEKPSENTGLRFGILGNDVLKRFNVIIDYQNGLIYLKPNRLLGIPYDKPFSLKKK